MMLTDDNGEARVLTKDGVYSATYSKDRDGYYDFVLSNGGSNFNCSDTDQRFDVYYTPSSDGTVFWDELKVLSPGEAADLPAVDELHAAAMVSIAPLMRSVAAGETDGSDLVFCNHIFHSPLWMHKAWLANGRDVAAAQRAILRDVFLLG